MSILINMEMPTDCMDCPLVDRDMVKCKLHEDEYSSWADEYKNCPLIEVPEHGRLIDADELARWMEECKRKNSIWDLYASGFARSFINNAPTVIPADKESET